MDQKRIGIIGAMEEEVARFKEQMTDTVISKRAGMEFIQGMLCGRDTVVVRSGIGKVNAAVCAQILCDVYEVDYIMNTGVAGSLNAEIEIGDIVISEEALQHDMDATGFGYAPGVIPRMETSVFPADPRLVTLAAEACAKANPDIRVFRGRILSGDQFISDKNTKERLAENFRGLCTEMEGGAVAQTAYLNGVPYLILRAISDKADDSASMAYDTFEKMAIRHTVRLVTELLPRL